MRWTNGNDFRKAKLATAGIITGPFQLALKKDDPDRFIKGFPRKSPYNAELK